MFYYDELSESTQNRYDATRDRVVAVMGPLQDHESLITLTLTSAEVYTLLMGLGSKNLYDLDYGLGEAEIVTNLNVTDAVLQVVERSVAVAAV